MLCFRPHDILINPHSKPRSMNIYSASCDVVHGASDEVRGVEEHGLTLPDPAWPVTRHAKHPASTSLPRLRSRSFLASVMAPLFTGTGLPPQKMRCTCISRRCKTGLTWCQEVAAPCWHNTVTSFCTSAQRNFEATVLTLYRRSHQAHHSYGLSRMPAAVHRLFPSSHVRDGQV
jgi:hypothetical protein